MIDDSKTIGVCTKQIGDIICIIESAISNDAKDTAYNKIKRLILDHADRWNRIVRLHSGGYFVSKDRQYNLTSSQ